MKILKNSTYENLQAEIRKHQDRASIYSDDLLTSKCDVYELQKRLFYASRRKVITGCKASGKTYTIQNDLLPDLNGKYFIIDLHMEYNAFNKHDGDVLSEMEIRDMIKREKDSGNGEVDEKAMRTQIIINHIEENRDKTLIIDGMDFFSINVGEDGYTRIIDSITGFGRERVLQDYILTFHSFKHYQQFDLRNGDATTQSIMQINDRVGNQELFRKKYFRGNEGIIYVTDAHR